MEYKIPGKTLGELNFQDHCKRCIWLKIHLGSKLPFNIFPGIFTSIDSFTKKVVHGYIDEHGIGPTYLNTLGDIVGYIEPPHHSKFYYIDPVTNIKLTGAADGILRLSDGTITVVDYKTAKFTKNQDKLLPMYEVQINVYALIAEQLGLGKVSKLALIYMEPQVEKDNKLHHHSNNKGFYMDFEAHILEIPINPFKVSQCLQQAKEILSHSGPLNGHHACKDCENIQKMNDLIFSR